MSISTVKEYANPEDAILRRDPDIKAIISRHMYRHFGSHQRSFEFIELAQHMEPKQFWTILHDQWSSFDAIDHFVMEQVISGFSEEWSADYLNEEDRAFYDSLPDMVTVYRGQGATQYTGLSWTTDYEVAKAFALGHRRHNPADPVIIKANVAKCDIAGAYANREESEIIVFTPSNLEIIGREAITPRTVSSFERDH